MSPFLPSEVAKLVLGYLEETSCFETYDVFLLESPFLEECRDLDLKEIEYRRGKKTLLSILQDYCDNEYDNGSFNAFESSENFENDETCCSKLCVHQHLQPDSASEVSNYPNKNNYLSMKKHTANQSNLTRQRNSSSHLQIPGTILNFVASLDVRNDLIQSLPNEPLKESDSVLPLEPASPLNNPVPVATIVRRAKQAVKHYSEHKFSERTSSEDVKNFEPSGDEAFSASGSDSEDSDFTPSDETEFDSNVPSVSLKVKKRKERLKKKRKERHKERRKERCKKRNKTNPESSKSADEPQEFNVSSNEKLSESSPKMSEIDQGFNYSHRKLPLLLPKVSEIDTSNQKNLNEDSKTRFLLKRKLRTTNKPRLKRGRPFKSMQQRASKNLFGVGDITDNDGADEPQESNFSSNKKLAEFLEKLSRSPKMPEIDTNNQKTSNEDSNTRVLRKRKHVTYKNSCRLPFHYKRPPLRARASVKVKKTNNHIDRSRRFNYTPYGKLRRILPKVLEISNLLSDNGETSVVTADVSQDLGHSKSVVKKNLEEDQTGEEKTSIPGQCLISEKSPVAKQNQLSEIPKVDASLPENLGDTGVDMLDRLSEVQALARVFLHKHRESQCKITSSIAEPINEAKSFDKSADVAQDSIESEENSTSQGISTLNVLIKEVIDKMKADPEMVEWQKSVSEQCEVKREVPDSTSTADDFLSRPFQFDAHNIKSENEDIIQDHKSSNSTVKLGNNDHIDENQNGFEVKQIKIEDQDVEVAEQEMNGLQVNSKNDDESGTNAKEILSGHKICQIVFLESANQSSEIANNVFSSTSSSIIVNKESNNPEVTSTIISTGGIQTSKFEESQRVNQPISNSSISISKNVVTNATVPQLSKNNNKKVRISVMSKLDKQSSCYGITQSPYSKSSRRSSKPKKPRANVYQDILNQVEKKTIVKKFIVPQDEGSGLANPLTIMPSVSNNSAYLYTTGPNSNSTSVQNPPQAYILWYNPVAPIQSTASGSSPVVINSNDSNLAYNTSVTVPDIPVHDNSTMSSVANNVFTFGTN